VVSLSSTKVHGFTNIFCTLNLTQTRPRFDEPFK